MNGQSFLDFRNELSNRGIVFTYSGFLNDDILTGIGNALRTKLALDHTDSKVSRGIFSAFVEQVQNVIRYSAETQGPEVDEEGGGYRRPLAEPRNPLRHGGDWRPSRRQTLCDLLQHD